MTTTMERVLTAELRMERERSRRLFDETQELRRTRINRRRGENNELRKWNDGIRKISHLR